MRIIGGTFRGKKLITPDNTLIRPTTDRMRETLFNMLEHGAGPGIRGSKVLDLFAGTGALGIEALSRGADHVTFVDNDPKSLKLVKQNTALLKSPADITYLKNDSTKIKNTLGQFDIIFIDPPYHKELIIPVLSNLDKENIISQNGIVIIEYASNESIELSDPFKTIKTRKLGEAAFSILEYNP